MNRYDVLHYAACPDCYMAAAGVLENPTPEWSDRYAGALLEIGNAGWRAPFPSSWPRDDGAEWSDDEMAGGLDCEPSFSWSPCDLCGDPLGGDRYPLDALRVIA
jgi:hypothetical protein